MTAFALTASSAEHTFKCLHRILRPTTATGAAACIKNSPPGQKMRLRGGGGRASQKTSRAIAPKRDQNRRRPLPVAEQTKRLVAVRNLLESLTGPLVPVDPLSRRANLQNRRPSQDARDIAGVADLRQRLLVSRNRRRAEEEARAAAQISNNEALRKRVADERAVREAEERKRAEDEAARERTRVITAAQRKTDGVLSAPKQPTKRGGNAGKAGNNRIPAARENPKDYEPLQDTLSDMVAKHTLAQQEIQRRQAENDADQVLIIAQDEHRRRHAAEEARAAHPQTRSLAAAERHEYLLRWRGGSQGREMRSAPAQDFINRRRTLFAKWRREEEPFRRAAKVQDEQWARLGRNAAMRNRRARYQETMAREAARETENESWNAERLELLLGGVTPQGNRDGGGIRADYEEDTCRRGIRELIGRDAGLGRGIEFEYIPPQVDDAGQDPLLVNYRPGGTPNSLLCLHLGHVGRGRKRGYDYFTGNQDYPSSVPGFPAPDPAWGDGDILGGGEEEELNIWESFEDYEKEQDAIQSAVV